MGNPPKWRKNGVNKPVTSNVIGYIWEIHAISTTFVISAQTLYNYGLRRTGLYIGKKENSILI